MSAAVTPGRPAGGGRDSRSPGFPRPAHRDVDMARAVFTFAFIVIARSGVAPAPDSLLDGTSRDPGRDLAGMARPGWGQSGAVSCLGVPLPGPARPAPGSLGYQGAGI